MRIDDINAGSASRAGAEALERVAPRTVAQDSVGPDKHEARDTVEISSLSSSVSAAASREARIERLRIEVEAGRYCAPASEVARVIVDETLREQNK